MVSPCSKCGRARRPSTEAKHGDGLCGLCHAKKKEWLSDGAKARAAKYRSKPEVAEQIKAKAAARYLAIKADPERYARHLAQMRKTDRKAKGFAVPHGETRAGKCEICARHFARLCLDHDHDTGAERGWLCDRCNRGLGFFADSYTRLEDAARYLRARKRSHLRVA